MPVTLATLVRRPSLGLTALTDREGLDREITWVHASELLDPTPYLEGGELLLSVGMWLAPGTAMRPAGMGHALAYVDRLVRTGVAGLGFGVGLTHADVPPALVEAAAARGLPLLSVPEKTPFIAISRVVWEAMATDQNAEMARTFQAQQALTRAAVAAGAAGLVRRLAERLGGWVVLLDAAGRDFGPGDHALGAQKGQGDAQFACGFTGTRAGGRSASLRCSGGRHRSQEHQTQPH